MVCPHIASENSDQVALRKHDGAKVYTRAIEGLWALENIDVRDNRYMSRLVLPLIINVFEDAGIATQPHFHGCNGTIIINLLRAVIVDIAG